MPALLEAVLITSPEQVELLRTIRNETRWDFSHDNGEISEMRQRAWWVTMRGRLCAWLYYDTGELIGFGLVRQTEDQRWWNSLAVLPGYRSRGYGSAITTDLLHQHAGPIYASVKATNQPALAMHHLTEWEMIDGPDTSLVYFRSR